MRKRFTAVLTALAAALVVAAGAGAAVGPPFTPVMSGLDNPRGLDWGPDGGLYVVEAGVGGNKRCFNFEGNRQFAGPSGAVSRLLGGTQMRVARGFPSWTDRSGVAATGLHDISFHGPGLAKLAIGLGANPADRSQCQPFASALGWLAQLALDGSSSKPWYLVADLAAYELAVNPGGGPPDSNPHGVLAEGLTSYATDAGGNTLLKIEGGVISTVASFPSREDGRDTDSVPTEVVRGPDGALYVGELTGFPFAPGSANVWRVVPGEEPTVYRDGFTGIIDIAFGEDGSLYVLEFATEPFLEGPGDLIRVEPDGTRSVVATGFVTPTSVLLGEEGVFYVSNCGIFPGAGPFPCNGEVVRFEAD